MFCRPVSRPLHVRRAARERRDGVRAATAPPLPTLVLDTYPPAAREAIARAHREAVAKGGAEARRSAGRVLQAWEQWDAAHQAYWRAEALAPRTFECTYWTRWSCSAWPDPGEAAANSRGPGRLLRIPGGTDEARGIATDAGELAESQKLFSAMTDPACGPRTRFGLGRIAAAQGGTRGRRIFPARPRSSLNSARRTTRLRSPAARSGGRREARACACRAREVWRPLARSRRPCSGNRHRLCARMPGALLQRGIKLAGDDDLDGAIAAHEAAREARSLARTGAREPR